MKRLFALLLFSIILFGVISEAQAQDTPFQNKYPAAANSAASLGEARDNARTILKASLGSGATTITVSDTSRFPSSGPLTIDNREIVFYTGKTPTSFTGVLRGREGTAALVHAAGVIVEQRILSVYHNTLSAAVRALEAKVGVTDSTPSGSGKLLLSTGANATQWLDHTLDRLIDVDTSGAANGNVLTFNGTSWAPAAIGATNTVNVRAVDGTPTIVGAPTIEFDEADGFVITEQAGTVARIKLDLTTSYQQLSQKNQANGYAGLTAGTKLNAAQGQEVWSVTDLTDYTGVSGTGSTAIRATITAPEPGHAIVWDGANWVNAAGGGGGLTCTSCTTDRLTKYNGSSLVDSLLIEEASNVLAQRNTTNAQLLRVYNTFTDASNYERVRAGFDANVFYLTTEKAGTGSARNIALGSETTGSLFLRSSAINYWVLDGTTTGTFRPTIDNTSSIGSLSQRVANIILAGRLDVTTGYIELGERAIPNTSANEVQLYAKDVGGVSNLFVQRDDGSEFQVGAGGGSGPAGSGNELQAREDASTFRAVTGSSVDTLGAVALAPSARSSGSPYTLKVTGPADTALAADTEAVGLDFDLDATRQFTAGGGAFPTQREVLFRAPTYSATAAETITRAATLAITGAPIAGTNMTISEPLALFVQGGDIRLSSPLITLDTANINGETNIHFYDGTNPVSRILARRSSGYYGLAALQNGGIDFRIYDDQSSVLFRIGNRATSGDAQIIVPLGVGNSAPSGTQLHVISGDAARVGMIVSSAASPSTDIAKFQVNGTDGVVVTSTGKLKVPSGDYLAPAIRSPLFPDAGIFFSGGSENMFAVSSGSVYAFDVGSGATQADVRIGLGNLQFGPGSLHNTPTDTSITRVAPLVLKFGGGGAGGIGGTFSAVATSPSQITTDQNNYNPGDPSYFQRWSSDALRNVTGLTFTDAQVDGQFHVVHNIGSQSIVLVHESASSTAANRFTSSTGSDITLGPNETAQAQYDDTTDRWRVSKLGGAGGGDVTASSTTTFTNKTYDAEATGNVLTIPVRYWLPAAAVIASTASSLYDLPTANAPTPTAVIGTNIIKGVLEFPDSDGDYTAQITEHLPSDFTGQVDAKFRWFSSTATTGDVVWQLQTACTADGETDDPSWNTASTVTDTAKGTVDQMNDASISNVTITGCGASETLHLRILRNRTHASDTISGIVKLVGLEITLRRAM